MKPFEPTPFRPKWKGDTRHSPTSVTAPLGVGMAATYPIGLPSIKGLLTVFFLSIFACREFFGSLLSVFCLPNFFFGTFRVVFVCRVPIRNTRQHVPTQQKQFF
jgi:hypothetical protein